MPHERAVIQKLIHVNQTTIINYEVDTFFTFNVLYRRLKNPLKQHVNTLCSVYNMFHSRFHKECRYTELFVNQQEKDIFFTVFFDCGEHSFMLMFLSQHETALDDQHKVLQDLLADYEDIKESRVSIHDESLPTNIHSLIRELLLYKDKKELYLKKIETTKSGKTILFYQVSFPTDFNGTRGLSILAGFQY